MKRQNRDKVPYLSVCLIVRNCECSLPGGLERCLQSIRERTPDAEIVVVDTMSSDDGIDVKLQLRPGLDARQVRTALREQAGIEAVFVEPPDAEMGSVKSTVRVRPKSDLDVAGMLQKVLALVGTEALPGTPNFSAYTSSGPGTIEIAKKYADIFEQYRGPKGDWDEEMSYFDDAAAARQRSFELASGTWRLWIDADDLWLGPDESERFLRINGRWQVPDTGRPDLADAPGGGTGVMDFEDILHDLEAKHPKLDCIWMPYLYRSTPEGKVLVWQERERCIKWGDGKTWKWAEAAHEVLVPVDPAHMQTHGQLHMEHTLILHKKRFTVEDDLYAVVRHWDVQLKRYEAGERTTRICRYLSYYADRFAPGRKAEFIQSALEVAALPTERYQALVEQGHWYAARGLYTETIESYGAAHTLRPDLPDALIGLASAATNAGDLTRAVDSLQRALTTRPQYADSGIGPHDFQVGLPKMLVEALWTLSAEQVRRGFHDAAERNLEAARNLAVQVYNLPMTQMNKEDAQEAYSFMARARNAYESQKHARQIHELWDFLVRNDETLKASELLRVVPHTLLDHPLMIQIERWYRKLDQHFCDPTSYKEFYSDLGATNGTKPSMQFAPYCLDPVNALPRVKWLIEWIQKNCPNGRILEVGPFDGITAIPVLRACPGVQYTAVEVQDQAIEWFHEGARKLVPDAEARLKILKGTDEDLERLLHTDCFHVVVFFEVLEHVPFPMNSIFYLLDHLLPNGRLFLSTPWGAYDNGSPVNLDKRDPRGHVRAMTPGDVVHMVRAAHGEVETLYNSRTTYHWGDTMHVMARRGSEERKNRRPIAFCIHGSLWDWNASHVEDTGIGASEETIVYLARELAKTDRQRVEVYGQVNEIEVKDRVAYWPREQMRRIRHDARVIVSRAPSLAALIDDAVVSPPQGKILWLQDTSYPDLNEATAAAYETIVVPTAWHKELVHERHKVPLDQMAVIPNFLLREHFVVADPPKREPFHFIYASSPDRGLVNIDGVPGILDLWPEILKRWPEATLDIFYGWNGCARLSWTSPEWTKRYRAVRERYEVLRWQKGVRERGRVNHAAIAREMMRASVCAYSTGFFETFGSNFLKARAAGCVVVCPPLGGLSESAKCPETRYVKLGAPDDYRGDFLEGVREAIETPESVRQGMARAAIEEGCIERVLPLWQKVLGLHA